MQSKCMYTFALSVFIRGTWDTDKGGGEGGEAQACAY
jgi:hypothetical protein